jgi:endonuclease-8
MPEGPSIVILKEALQPFKGRKIIAVTGNAKLDLSRLDHEKIIDFKSWGKHFLICFKGFTLRIHFLLFGSYSVNERKAVPPRLRLSFIKGEISFYSCSMKWIEGSLDNVYDWQADVMDINWNPRKAAKKLQAIPDAWVCDVLLDQDIFAGVGTIIKNEVLYRIRVHPKSRVGSLPAPKRSALIRGARQYSFQFLEWKKAFVLRKHWLAYKKSICPRCNIPFKKEALGKTNRRSFFCSNCQTLYSQELK